MDFSMRDLNEIEVEAVVGAVLFLGPPVTDGNGSTTTPGFLGPPATDGSSQTWLFLGPPATN